MGSTTGIADATGIDRRRLHQDLLTVQQRLAEVRATAESHDGLISATVGGRGELLELALDPRIYRDPDSRALAREITDTIHRARKLAADQAFALTRRVLAPGADRAETDLGFDPLLQHLDRETRRGGW
ncbi:YbaB/EbfC family nucleoid-associated protein [Micromonospora sp. NPDC007230]|uniref:YbaB/EbfC family nucleoid-associated protein n=1 Tax=Micromonospora sp. NPDC007230 TaxID=3364237 RepID=UPI0036B98C88